MNYYTIGIIKMTQQYYFLSGIARSGSTLLGSILNQNPRFHVTPTSPLLDFFCMTENSIRELTKQYTYDAASVSMSVHKAIGSVFYEHLNSPVVIDKHRGWPRNIGTIKSIITPNPKVICTYRHIAENVVSFLKLAQQDPDNFVDKTLRQQGKQINTHNRAICIWENYSSDPFYSMVHGLTHYRDSILVVDYHNLVADAPAEMRRIYEFLEEQPFEHTYTNIHNTCAENDQNWGMKNLHIIRPNLQITSDDPRTVLGDELYDYFDKVNHQLSRLI